MQAPLPGLALHSGFLFNIARAASEHSIDKKSDALVAIIFSFSALECFVNEVPEFVDVINKYTNDDLPVEILNCATALRIAEENNAPLRLKIQLMKITLSGSCYDKGKLPYQDLELLIKVRNTIMHPRAKEFDLADELSTPRGMEKLVQQLESRSAISKRSRSWFGVISQPSMASWAYKLAIQIYTDLISSMPKSTLRREYEFGFPNDE